MHLKPKPEDVLFPALLSGKFKAIAWATVHFNLKENAETHSLVTSKACSYFTESFLFSPSELTAARGLGVYGSCLWLGKAGGCCSACSGQRPNVSCPMFQISQGSSVLRHLLWHRLAPLKTLPLVLWAASICWEFLGVKNLWIEIWIVFHILNWSLHLTRHLMPVKASLIAGMGYCSFCT